MSDSGRTRRRLRAQTGAARVLLSTDTVPEGIEALLRVVCESHGWSVGEFWAPSPEGPVLRLESQWTDPEADLDPLVEATASLTFTAGSGLAGRVWDRDEPVRIPRVTDDPDLIRAEAAKACGLQGAYAVPVPLTGTNAVLLFLDDDPADDDPQLMDSLAALGAQLGQFIDRRRAEQEVRESEDRLRFQARLLDAVGEAVIATQLDGTVMYWNEAAERLYGWSAGEVLGRTVDQITPADVSRAQAEDIMARLREGESWSGEFLVRDKAGREFPIMVTDSPFLDEHGEVVGMIGTSSDISGRKRSESAQRFLAEAGRILAASLDYPTTARTVARLAVPTLADYCIVQVVDEGGELETVASVSDHDDRLLRDLEGWAEGPGRPALVDVLRRCEAMAAPASDGPEVLEDDGLRELGAPSALCVPLRARGNALGVMTLASESEYTDGDIRLAAEVGRRAALALDNARLYRDAQEANRAKADFLAVVSHELRTPLNAIGGYVDLLEGGVEGELSEGQAGYVERIRLGAGHLAQLIDEILTFARVEAHREQLLFRPVDLGGLVADAMAVMEAQAGEKDLALQLDAPPTGPELVTDADKVRQIVVNLLSNAIKYTDEGSVTATLRPADDGGAVLAVSDTGIGIEPEHLSQVFEPFWQAESPSTRRAGGTGLGLAVNQRLTALLGGTIEAESQPGAGSVFTVRLPPRPPAERPDVDRATERAATS